MTFISLLIMLVIHFRKSGVVCWVIGVAAGSGERLRVRRFYPVLGCLWLMTSTLNDWTLFDFFVLTVCFKLCFRALIRFSEFLFYFVLFFKEKMFYLLSVVCLESVFYVLCAVYFRKRINLFTICILVGFRFSS